MYSKTSIRTRELLFRYCETLSPADYVKEVEPLGGASIRNLHAHAADCYRVWLGNRAFGKSLSKIKPESVSNVQEMREIFKKTGPTNSIVEDKLKNWADSSDISRPK